MFKSKLTALLFVLIISFPPKIYSQSNSSFEYGEILLSNGETIKGYIRIAQKPGANSTVYYREFKTSSVVEYFVFDLISITLDYGKKLIVSEGFPFPEGTIRKFAQVHFKGDYILYSIREGGRISYFIKDNRGEITELLNTYNLPVSGQSNKIQINSEYKETLKSMLGNDAGTTKQIAASEFNPESLSRLLRKYHSSKKIDYTTYPPPTFKAFTGGGTSIQFINHQSDLDKNFTSTSPFGGISFQAGVIVSDRDLEIFIESSLLYGIFFHDNAIELNTEITGYYEDISKVTLFSNSLNLGISPVKFGKFSPYFGMGVSYNNFLSFTREIREELFYKEYDLVINNYEDTFTKPDSYFGFSGKAGLTYSLSINNQLRIGYRYEKYFVDEAGSKNLQGVTISFIHKFF